MIEQNIVLADHLPDVENTTSVDVSQLTSQVQEYFTGLGTSFKKRIALFKAHGVEFFQIVQVKSVGPILQERHGKDCFFVEELGKLNFQIGWQDTQKVGHVRACFTLESALVLLKVMS